MRLIVLISLALASCAGPELHARAVPDPVVYWRAISFPIVLVPIEGTDPVVIDYFEDAAGYWNTLVGDTVFTTVASGPPYGAGVLIVGECSDCGGPSDVGYCKPPVSGIGSVYLSKGAAFHHRVAVHELGHALGFGHHPNPKNVMYFAATKPPWVVGNRAVKFVQELMSKK